MKISRTFITLAFVIMCALGASNANAILGEIVEGAVRGTEVLTEGAVRTVEAAADVATAPFTGRRYYYPAEREVVETVPVETEEEYVYSDENGDEYD